MMDIFDAVTTWLEKEKAKGKDKLYLSKEARELFDNFISMSTDPASLQQWLAVNGSEPHVEPSVEVTSPDVVSETSTQVESAQPATPVAVEDVEPVSPEPIVEDVPSSIPQVEPPSVAVRDEIAASVDRAKIDTTSEQTVVQNVVAVASGDEYQISVSGSEKAELMFLGEEMFIADGQLPFAQSQDLFKKMVAAMNFSWDEIAIASVLKKRELIASEDLLRSELDKLIREVNPKVVAIMGALPSRVLLGTTDSILNIHGQWLRYGNYPCMPTFHPFYLSRVKERKRQAWSDLQQIMSYLGRLPVTK